MHDPKSFEHVDTSYKSLGDDALIVMNYRGNNKLGMKALNQVKATVKINDCQSIVDIVFD